jgi:hypothetical protein
MISPAADLRLHASARSGLRLRSGDFVSVEVVRRLTGGKWEVSIQGRLLPARTRVELFPGQRLRAQVFLEGRQVRLRLSEPAGSPVRELLARAGLPADAASEAIAVALLRSGLSANPRNVGQARELLERLRLDPRRFSRLVALLLEKGIDIRSAGVADLLAVLGHGQGEAGEDSRRFRRRQTKGQPQDVAEALRGIVEEAEAQSGLQVFNHLRGRDGSWVIVPYSLSFDPGERIDGSIRLLYDDVGRTTTRAVVTARVERGGRASALWSFRIQKREGGLHLECCCDDEKTIRAAQGRLPGLIRKLGNLGVKADDTIHKDDAFDGFSPPGEDVSYRAVDTVG